MLKDGVSLALRLAVGLAAAPLLGLALAAGRGKAAPLAASLREREPAAPPQTAEEGALCRDLDGPDRGAIERALRDLADATVAKRAPSKPKAFSRSAAKIAAPSQTAPGREPGRKRVKRPLSTDHIASRHP